MVNATKRVREALARFYPDDAPWIDFNNCEIIVHEGSCPMGIGPNHVLLTDGVYEEFKDSGITYHVTQS